MKASQIRVALASGTVPARPSPTENAHERQPVADRVSVRSSVSRYMSSVINRSPVAFHPARVPHSVLKIAVEPLETHYRAPSLQAVPFGRELSKCFGPCAWRGLTGRAHCFPMVAGW